MSANITPSEHEIRLARIAHPTQPLSEEERKRRTQAFRENLQRLEGELFIPLSLRRKVTDAIEAARPGYADQTLASAQAEAAIEALRPFMEALVAETPNQSLLNPSDEGPGSAEHVQPCGHDDSSAVGSEPESPNADTSVEVPHRGGGGGADSCTSPLSRERITANVTVGERRPSIDAQLGEFQDLLHRLWRAAIRLSNGEPAPQGGRVS